MSSITSYAKENILTITFLEQRVLEDTKLEKLSQEVLAELNKTTEQKVILDFSNVQFMSSSMLGKLVQIQKKCKEFKIKLKLCSIDKEIREVFKITKLDKLFDIVPDEATARKAFLKKGWL